MKNHFILTKYVAIPLAVALFAANTSVYLNIYEFPDITSWSEYLKSSSDFFKPLFRVPLQLFFLDFAIFLVYEHKILENRITSIKIKDVVARNKFKWLWVLILFSISLVIQFYSEFLIDKFNLFQ